MKVENRSVMHRRRTRSWGNSIDVGGGDSSKAAKTTSLGGVNEFTIDLRNGEEM